MKLVYNWLNGKATYEKQKMLKEINKIFLI